ncbi:MAG: saccharopine dehydrogenase NADP-binding domain-containing protein [Armatimonadetes bacterium]|nr:saccharopine dehydrogenase NADP-binding domain-containing protein [Armatimonadota bacterium]CUU35346.1 lysine 6-dehydrogenase [Armatimonadetes bacterium DC]
MSSFRYAILGAGMQGPAVAYDLARFGNAEVIYLADIDLERATQKAEWVNQLLQKQIVFPRRVDARDEKQVLDYFSEADVVISAVPWQMNMRLIQLALDAKRSFIDMGNDPEWFWYEFRKRDEEAKEAGIALVPDCGLAPGMVNHLGLYCMEKMDTCHEIRLRCGGLPQRPVGPLGYKLVFNMIGVISEYTGEALVLREGKPTYVPTLEDIEYLEIEELGLLEAAPTSGGTSTAPYTLAGKVQEYDYKTLRYPGHWDIMRALRDLGFFDEEPIKVEGHPVIPRQFTATVIPPKIDFPEEKDLVVVWVYASGEKNGAPYEISVQYIDYHDDETGFTAMERCTGFSASIIAIGVANGTVPRGIVPYEQSMSGHVFVREFLKRGFVLRETVSHTVQP